MLRLRSNIRKISKLIFHKIYFPVIFLANIFSKQSRLKNKETIAHNKQDYKKEKQFLAARINALANHRYTESENEQKLCINQEHVARRHLKEYLFLAVRYHQLFGSFSEALKWRKKYHELNTSDIPVTNANISDYLKSCVEADKGLSILNALKRYDDTELIQTPLLLEFLALSLNLTQKHAAARSIRKRYLYNINDNMYSSSLRGKRIALIGPLIDYRKKEFANMSADYDYVIVLNLKLKQFKTSSFRIDATYYNICSKKEDIADIINLSKNLDCISFFWKKGVDVISKEGFSEHCMLRLMKNPRDLVHNSYVPNMLQNVVYDLVYLGPKSINLFGFNGYLSKSIYADGYQDSLAKQSWVPFGMRIHEPFSNFSLIHNLLKAGVIRVDEIGEVFRMNINDYAAELDNVYGTMTLDKWKPIA